MIINRCFKIRSLILAAALVSSLSLVNHANAREWRALLIDLSSGTATDLGTLGGNSSEAYGLNDLAQVVGWFSTAEGNYRAFITGADGMGMRDLGAGDFSRANDINNSGQVVGSFQGRYSFIHAFITGPNGVGIADLGTLGGGYGSANAINEAEQVVGHSYPAGGELPNAFITDPAVFPTIAGMRSLGLGKDTYSTATDINNTGQVVGYWNGKAYITGPNGEGVAQLGTLGGPYSDATAINEIGQVVGSSWTSTDSSAEHAFIAGPDGLEMVDLGTLGGSGSRAYGINDIGQIAGSSQVSNGDWHAFVTGPDGTDMVDLNSLVDLPEGVTLIRARDINNAGQVVAVIPEPASYLLMLAGLTLVGFIARRKNLPLAGGFQWN